MKKSKPTGVSETRKWHGKTYYLFDFCHTEEETRQEYVTCVKRATLPTTDSVRVVSTSLLALKNKT